MVIPDPELCRVGRLDICFCNDGLVSDSIRVGNVGIRWGIISGMVVEYCPVALCDRNVTLRNIPKVGAE